MLGMLNDRSTDMAQIECDLGKKHYDYKGERGVAGEKDLDYDKAFAHFQKAANEGNTDAQFYLGRMYDLGHGVERDYHEARKWYELAAKKGNAKAQNNLGNLYRDGLGGKQNYIKAFELFSQSAENKLLVGKLNLDSLCRERIENNDQKFLKELIQLAEGGHITAQDKLSYWYRIDKSIEGHEEKSLYWLTKVADQGIREAQYELGRAYEKGELGVGINQDKAYELYSKAADQGHFRARSGRDRLSLNGR